VADRDFRGKELSAEQMTLLAPGQRQQLGDLFELESGVAAENGHH